MRSFSASMKSIRAFLAVVALTFVAAPRAMPAPAALRQLQGIQELKSWFNASKGHPRLILLLSPT
jgi:hypothetical protein